MLDLLFGASCSIDLCTSVPCHLKGRESNCAGCVMNQDRLYGCCKLNAH